MDRATLQNVKGAAQSIPIVILSIMPLIDAVAPASIPESTAAGGGLTITATVVSSIRLAFTPESRPRITVTNATDSAETFFRLVPEPEDCTEEPQRQDGNEGNSQ